MKNFKVFETIQSDQQITIKDGCQCFQLHWVFAIKHDFLQTRLLVGENVANSDDLEECASTASLGGVQLKLLFMDWSRKQLTPGDFISAYLHRWTNNNKLNSFVPEFGNDAEQVQVIKSLYGHITSAHIEYELFTSSIIREYGFNPSEIMPCIWQQLAKKVIWLPVTSCILFLTYLLLVLGFPWTSNEGLNGEWWCISGCAPWDEY